jgi:hypothetical protein
MARTTWILCTALLLFAFDASPTAAEDEPQSGAPPSITYGGSRSSSTWVTLPSGLRVAVGEGVAWKGVRVHLSLTWQLVGVDVATGKALFGADVSAFWNGIGFKEVTPKGGKKTWAIELRPGPRMRGRALREYRDLRTGRKLDVPGPDVAPSGAPLPVRASWNGEKSDVAEPFAAIVTTPKNWMDLRARMFPAVDPERFGPVDFAKEVVLLVSHGNSWNCSGITLHSAYEDDDRVLVRLGRRTFQTINGGKKTRPWGAIVLPKRAEKAYVIERNAQNLIGGPPLWREQHRFAKLGPAEEELAKVPAKSESPHWGWESADEEEMPPPPKRPPGK